MINIKIKGVYTLDEALEVLNLLQKEETTEGVGYWLDVGETDEIQHNGIYNDYVFIYDKKDFKLNIKVIKLKESKK